MYVCIYIYYICMYIYIYIYISAGTKTKGHKGGHEHKLSSQVVRFFFRIVCVWFQRLFPDEKSLRNRPAQLPLLAPVPVLGLAPAMAPRSPSRSMDPKNHGFPILQFPHDHETYLVVDLPPWKIWKSDWIIIPTIGENKKCSKSPTSYSNHSTSKWLLKPVKFRTKLDNATQPEHLSWTTCVYIYMYMYICIPLQSFIDQWNV